METKFVVMLAMGIACVVFGFLMLVNKDVAEWGVSTGRAQIWIWLLGKERAVTLSQYFFGPLTIVFGVIAIVYAFTGP